MWPLRLRTRLTRTLGGIRPTRLEPATPERKRRIVNLPRAYARAAFPLRHSYVGPFKDGSSYYGVFSNLDDRRIIEVFRSTGDPTVASTWASTGSVFKFTNNVGALWTTQTSGQIHVAVIEETTGRVSYHRYNTTDDRWDVVNDQVVLPAAGPVGQPSVQVVIRSTNEIIVVYNELSGAHDRLQLGRSPSGGGSWTIHTVATPGGVDDIIGGAAVLGASDRVHIFYQLTSSDDALHRTFKGDQTFGTAQTIDAAANATGTIEYWTNAVAYVDGGSTVIKAGYYDASAQLSGVHGTSADDPTWSIDVDFSDVDVDNLDDTVVASYALNGTTVEAVYGRFSDQDIYSDSQPNGGAFGTDVARNTSVTANAISANSYDRSGAKVAYFWEDDATLAPVYSEYEAAAAATTITPDPVPIPFDQPVPLVTLTVLPDPVTDPISTPAPTVTLGLTPSPVATPITPVGPSVTLGVNPSPAETDIDAPVPTVTLGVNPSPVAVPITPVAPSVTLGVNPSPAETDIDAPAPSLTLAIAPSPVAVPIVVPDPIISRPVTPDPVPIPLATPTPALTLTVTPSPVDMPVAVPVPTVTLTVAPAPAATDIDVVGPSVTLGATPSAVPVPLDVPAPTVTLTVAPAPVAVPIIVPDPTVSEAQLIAPSPVTVPLDVPVPLVTLTLTPDPITVPVAVPVPTITLALAPDPAVTDIDVAGPSVTLGATPDPTTVPIAVPGPSVILTLTPDSIAIPIAVTAAAVTLTILPVPASVDIDVADPTATLTAAPGAVPVPLDIPAPLVTLTVTPAPVPVPIVVPDPTIGTDTIINVTPIPIPIDVPIPLVTLTVLPAPVEVPIVVPDPTVSTDVVVTPSVAPTAGPGTWAPPPARRMPRLPIRRRRHGLRLRLVTGGRGGANLIRLLIIRRRWRFHTGGCGAVYAVPLSQTRRIGGRVRTAASGRCRLSTADFIAGRTRAAPARLHIVARVRGGVGIMHGARGAVGMDFEDEELALLGLPSEHELASAGE